jgi:hypothetical protein
VIVSAPVAAPFAVGANTTLTAQLAPVASVVPHVVAVTANGADAAIDANVKSPASLFVIVTVRALLVVPTVIVPKLSDVGESVTGAVPVPLKATTCGLVSALSITTRLPLAAPSAAGTNWTPTLQLAPALSALPQVVLAIVNGAVAVMLAIASAAGSRFVIVTDRTVLTLPTTTLPKLMLLADNDTGALPLPVSATVCVPASSVIVMAPDAAPTAAGTNAT